MPLQHINDPSKADPIELPIGDQYRSRRQVWAQERRIMEAEKAFFGPDGRRSSLRSRAFAVGLVLLNRVIRWIGLHHRGRRNALNIQLVNRSISFPSLPPSFDGYRILHLSDTHLDYLPELAGVAARLLTGIEVDLLVLTGDIHGDHRSPLAASTGPLAKIVGTVCVKGHRFAVLGNHDQVDMADALEELGFVVLINESAVLSKRGQHIVLTGLDDVHRFYTPETLRALSRSPEGFRIALIHSPELADNAAAAGYALYLCGHTHGGQICLPGGRPIFTHLRNCHYAKIGAWSKGNMFGYTSRGLGVSDVPLRFNCRGEISIITLRQLVEIQHTQTGESLVVSTAESLLSKADAPAGGAASAPTSTSF